MRLKGPGWSLVTVLPTSVVSANAVRAARYVLLFGVLSLMLELAIMSWVLKQQITQPLLVLTQATSRLEAGDFQVALDTSRTDELGRLASGLPEHGRRDPTARGSPAPGQRAAGAARARSAPAS